MAKAKKKTEKKPIAPADDVVQVVEGGEALAEEIGEITNDLMKYRDSMGRLRGGRDDAFRYRVIPSDTPQEMARQKDIEWRHQGFERVTGIECVGLPGMCYRTTRENAEKISALKAKRAVDERKRSAAPAGLAGTKVDYSEGPEIGAEE